MVNNNELLPLLSKSFKKTLIHLAKTCNSEIAKYLVEVNNLINRYNELLPSETYLKLIEHKQIKIDGIKDTEEIIQDLILEEINKRVNCSIRMITLLDTFEISFLPCGKEPIYTEDGKWSKENRQTGKPTRLLRRLIAQKIFCDADYEAFNNQLHALILESDTPRLVSGKDISFWYNENTYYELKYTLGNSCMRYDGIDHYFEVYEDNAEMLIITKQGKLLARAIVWTYKGNKILDRVYAIDDAVCQKMINYAKEQKWIIRVDQCAWSVYESFYFRSSEDNYKSSIKFPIYIELDKKYEYFPFMDTLKYWYPDEKYISTEIDESKECCVLEDTGGGWDDLANYQDGDEDDSGYCCSNCNADIYEDQERWSEYYNSWVCEYCGTWSSIMDDWILESDCVIVYVYNGKGSTPNYYGKISVDCNYTDYGVVCIDGDVYNFDPEYMKQNEFGDYYFYK